MDFREESQPQHLLYPGSSEVLSSSNVSLKKEQGLRKEKEEEEGQNKHPLCFWVLHLEPPSCLISLRAPQRHEDVVRTAPAVDHK